MKQQKKTKSRHFMSNGKKNNNSLNLASQLICNPFHYKNSNIFDFSHEEKVINTYVIQIG